MSQSKPQPVDELILWSSDHPDPGEYTVVGHPLPPAPPWVPCCECVADPCNGGLGRRLKRPLASRSAPRLAGHGCIFGRKKP